jgi:hypothetical protein
MQSHAFQQSWFLTELLPRLRLREVRLLGTTCSAVNEAVVANRETVALVDRAYVESRRIFFRNLFAYHEYGFEVASVGWLVKRDEPTPRVRFVDVDIVCEQCKAIRGETAFSCRHATSRPLWQAKEPVKVKTLLEQLYFVFVGPGCEFPLPEGYCHMSIIHVLEWGLYTRLNGPDGVQQDTFYLSVDEAAEIIDRVLGGGSSVNVYGMTLRPDERDFDSFVKFVFGNARDLSEKVRLLKNEPFSADLWRRMCSVDDMIRMGL